MRLLITLFLIGSISCLSETQAQNFGGHPPSVKWLQINTDVVRVIFPSGQEEEATRIASLINYIKSDKVQSIGNRVKKIDLVLQTNQVISNGYVSLMPFRSEFYATPFQNNHTLSSANWLDVLSIHEYRHALQYANANRGATRVFNIISGQAGWFAAMNLSVPNWYFEGDAVVSETVLSTSGRGRTPSFFKEQRALLLSDIDYSYMKARNGSFKDLVPNHYPLGYAIMNYGRNNFGSTIWKDVLADAGAYSSIVYPFSGAMKKHTGMRAPKMYKSAYSELKDQWSNELSSLELTNQDAITPENRKTVTNNQFANYLEDGSLVYLSSSYKKTPAIYLIKDGKASKLTSVGTSYSTYLSENNGMLAWTEYEVDPRWTNRNYTKVMAYDLATKEKKVITTQSKLFSPQFSSDGSRIVATQFTNDLNSNVVILDAESGEIIQSIPNPENHFISYPNWSRSDASIIYLAKKNSELAILKYDLTSKQIIPLTNWTSHAIGRISVGSDRVVFSASYTGIDNIFSVDLEGSKQIVQLSSVEVGAYQPDISTNEQEIVMSEFTPNGYILTSLLLTDAKGDLFDLKEPTEMDRFNISISEDEGSILDEVPNKNYEVEKYRGILDGTKLHSWGYSAENSYTGLYVGLTNILNDFNVDLNGIYNRNEQAFQYSGTVDYAKYFTVLSLKASVDDRSSVIINQARDAFILNEFNQTSFGAGLSIPLTWQHGNYTTGLTISSDLVNYHVDDNFATTSSAFNFSSYEAQLSFYNVRRKAYQNLQSRFGQYLFMYYGKTLNTIDGERFNTQAGFYLPGIAYNHGILIEYEYQNELLINPFQYPDYFNYARGYGYVPNDELARFSVNYQMPLLYPDWGFFNFAYFKRVKVNFFYDVAESVVNIVNYSLTQESYGAELTFENVMLNVLPVSFTFRQSLLPDAFDGDPSSNFEFFFQVSF